MKNLTSNIPEIWGEGGDDLQGEIDFSLKYTPLKLPVNWILFFKFIIERNNFPSFIKLLKI